MNAIPGILFDERLHEDDRIVLFRGHRGEGGDRALIRVLSADQPDPRSVAVLRREFEVAGSMDFEGVLRPVDFLRTPSGAAVVYEDFAGAPLATALAAGRLDLTTALEIAVRAAEVLGQIHRRDVIHKNISPASILVSLVDASARLTDFSICSRLSREHGRAVDPGTLEGSLAYMSPEQTGRMNRTIDYRSDLYSLGATLYEMFTGRAPFVSDDPMELVHCHIARAPIPPHIVAPDVPEALSTIVLKLLAKRAEDRYQSAFGLKADLETCLREWRTNRRITALHPGQYDVSSQLHIPEKLYGRETETSALLAAFDRASRGATELFIVAGYSGVGKSALVREVHKPIVAQRGYFAAGKFDQFQRDTPYTAMIEAFRDLLRQVLREKAYSVEQRRKALVTALGDAAQVIIDIIPEVELILGPQPPVPELPATEAQIRFSLLFQRFVAAFATKERPLALFIDDLQWADSATLSLIQRITTDPDTRFLLFIGAYRDNEVDLHHPLVLTLTQILRTGARLGEISLRPLGEADLGHLVSDTLGAPVPHCAPLTALIHEKTDGNPFYVNQFIRSLHEHDLLTFDPATGRWVWDLARIRAEEMTSNVVELMIRTLRRLPRATQDVLTLASCIGSKFDLTTLATVREASAERTAAEIWNAVREGLVLPLGDAYKLLRDETEPASGESLSAVDLRVRYRFLHDRVQQAASELVPDDERQRIHLRMGRLLLRDGATDERLFDIVNHLNAAVALIVDPAERLTLSQLNLRAGRRAMQSSAYDPAATYLGTGVKLLPASAWERHYDLALGLHAEAAEAEYMRLDVARGDALGAEVLKRARSPLEKVKVYELRIEIRMTEGRMPDACAEALEVLALLGVPVTPNPSKLTVLAAFLRLRMRLSRFSVEELKSLPDMTDEMKMEAMRILPKGAAAAYQCAPNLMALFVCKETELTLDYGASPHSAIAFAAWGVLLCAVVNDLEGAYRFGKLGLDVAYRFTEKKVWGRATFFFNCFHRHWKEPQSDCTEPMVQNRRTVIEAGDLECFAYCVYHPAYYAFFAGERLGRVHERLVEAIATSERLDLGHALPMANALMQAVVNLTDRADGRAALHGEFYEFGRDLAVIEEQDFRSAIYYVQLVQTLLAYFFGDFETAIEHAAAAERQVEAAMGMIIVPELNFYQSLALAAHARTLTGTARARLLRKVRKNQRLMGRWARSAPVNFAHKFDVVAAELASLRGDHAVAEDAYDRAIAGALENGFWHEQALADERAAVHYVMRGRTTIAGAYLRAAVGSYVHWGADAKVRALRDEYPELLRVEVSLGRSAQGTSTTHFGSDDALDLGSVVKASRVISGEIVLERLLASVLRIAIQNAGAQRGALVRCAEDGLFVEAQGDADHMEFPERELLSDEGHAWPAVVDYTVRTGEPVVIADAAADPAHQTDEYVQKCRPRSVLVVPTVNQGKLTGVLYLENNLVPDAFTPDRVAVLRMLASQVAVSWENARLYTDLSDLNVAYERFVPRQLLANLSKKSIVDVGLGDSAEREFSVMFADIRSFTSISEKMKPDENFRFINSYLGRMEPVVQAHGGFIDKYRGDSIMALFDRGPDQAVQAAVAMVQELESLNETRDAAGEPRIRVGIGLHTGPVMLGTIGGHDRMDGTVIGDTVNLAQRLESSTKIYGSNILVSEPTRAALLHPEQFRMRPLGTVKVKGKSRWVRIHEVMDGEPEDVIARKQTTQPDLEAGLRALADGDAAAATEGFQRVLQVHPDDRAACALLAARHDRPDD